MTTTLAFGVAVQLTHAAVQVIAEDHGIDLLHIKGPAANRLLYGPDSTQGRVSLDVDVMIRPGQADRMMAALLGCGWRLAYPFDDGSPFRHAATFLRDGLSSLDVHRSFPGIGLDAERAFDVLWAGRLAEPIAGYPCLVPADPAHRLILLLHAARDPGRRRDDVERLWTAVGEDDRRDVAALATELHAEVPLAAATGRLDEYVERREYALWRALTTGEHSPSRLWVARVRAEPTLAARVTTGVRLLSPKPARLAARLGRPPTWWDLAKVGASTVLAGARDVVRQASRARGRS